MTRRRRTATPETPLPPVADTLAVLDQLATRQYETKARTRRALEMPHRALHEVLSMIESYARYPDLVSRGVADNLHRLIRRALRLDDPKRFPPLPPRPSVLARTAGLTPEVTAAATLPSAAMPPERAAELFGVEGIEFEEREPMEVSR